MTLNVNNKIVDCFTNINNGECFAYNGGYYRMTYNADTDEWFGVKLSDGVIKRFDNNCRVQRLYRRIDY